MKNIVLVKLNGGLGNQMFQFALASVIASKHNSTILIDNNLFKLTKKKSGHTPRNYELGVFGIEKPSASEKDILYFEQLSFLNKIRRELHLNYPEICFEKNFSYNFKLKESKPPVYIRGFFQSYKYLKGFEDMLQERFRFPEESLDDLNKSLLNKIILTNSVSVHIRRGDYVEDKITQEFHGTCSLEYYKEAIGTFRNNNMEYEYFFFSDDIDWVVKKFRDLPVKKTFIDHNTERDSWKDMFLMSKSKHNIIANSSFSWWAAWLNKNPQKIVITPKIWFSNYEKEKHTYDLIPNKWIRL